MDRPFDFENCLDAEVIACEAVFMIASVPTVQAEAFALLRRPQTATDLIPEDRLEQYHAGFLKRAGLNPALARRAETPLGNVWVIPGDGKDLSQPGGLA